MSCMPCELVNPAFDFGQVGQAAYRYHTAAHPELSYLAACSVALCCQGQLLHTPQVPRLTRQILPILLVDGLELLDEDKSCLLGLGKLYWT